MSILDPSIKAKAVAVLQALRSAKPLAPATELQIFHERLAEFVAESAGIEGYDVTAEEVLIAAQALTDTERG